MVWPALIAAGASLAGGLLSKASADDARERSEDAAANNIALQKEFAQQGIRWKVEDAKAAGIHPLYALGAQTHSFAPVSVGMSSDTSMGNAVSSMGQDISRAINATRTGEERVTAFQKTVRDLTITKMGLENQLLSSQISRLNQPPSAPAMPGVHNRFLDGQGNAVPTSGKILDLIGPRALVHEKAMERQASDPLQPWQEAGAVADIGHSRTPSGWAPTRSKDLQDRADDDFIGMLTWNLRNRLMPTFGVNYAPPRKAPLGFEWRYMPFHQEYRLYRKSGTFAPIPGR